MSAAPDVLTAGESMVSFRAAGPFALGAPVTPRLAGAESNVAIGLARLGHRAAWAGRVGADPFGDLVLRELAAEGVATTHAVRDPKRPTGLMFLEQRTADVTRVEYHRAGSAGSRLSAVDLQAAVAAPPQVLHLTGITPALSETARDAVQIAAESASAAGVLVSLDINYRARLWSRAEARGALQRLTRRARLVIASDDELDLVGDGEEAGVVEELFARNVEEVAVKRGSAGATLWTRDQRHDVEAVRVTAVDTVGAGDAFSAGLLSGILDGLAPLARLERAATLGAFAVSTAGDWEGLPRRSELHLLEGHRSGDTLR